MNNVLKPDIQSDELICPITYEVFRDPVIAKDGQVYEREAITRWILQNGTSPFTREPLQVKELESDHHLKRLAVQRGNSILTSETTHGTVILPSFGQASPIVTQISIEQLNPIAEKRFPIKRRCNMSICEIICTSLLVVLVVSAMATIVIKVELSSSTYRLGF